MRRVEELDGLRGFAMVLVLIHHVVNVFTLWIELPPSQKYLALLVSRLLNTGFFGVDIFYVLSGFLITNILIKTRTRKDYWSGFHLKRGYRIVPLFVVVCVPIAIREVFLHHITALQAVLYLSPLSNWVILKVGTANPLNHIWSLGLQEQFYILWPFAVRFLPTRALLRTALALTAASILLYIVLALAHANPRYLFYSTGTHMTGIALGCALATALLLPSVRAWLQLYNVWGLRTALLLLCGELIVRLSVVAETDPQAAFGRLGTSLLAFSLMFEAIEGRLAAPVATFLNRRVLRWLGARSYAIYLLHMPVLAYTLGHLAPRLNGGGHSRLAIIVLVGVIFTTLLLAEISWHLIEEPALRIGARVTHRREALLQRTT